MVAVRKGDSDCLKVLCNHQFVWVGLSPRLQTDRTGMTPLMLAAAAGDKDMVAELLAVPWFDSTVEQPEKRRAKLAEFVNGARDKAGKTALRHATEGGHKDVVELLRQAGANEDGEK